MPRHVAHKIEELFDAVPLKRMNRHDGWMAVKSDMPTTAKQNPAACGFKRGCSSLLRSRR
jgi:hypothetical protein